MKLYIMTDCEGVAGVLNSKDWAHMDGRWYSLTIELLTKEVNAAIDGFSAAGAKEFLVCDGHGVGAISPVLLDERAELLRGLGNGFPYELDRTFDAIAWVGQHAMSRASGAHLPHTGSMRPLEYKVNGVAVGEFGQLAMCASELGVRSIFGSGDRAFCSEARALIPGIETVEVKRGTISGHGDECDVAQYRVRNVSAIHVHPARSREKIRVGAERALRRFATEEFGIIPLKPPFEMVKRFRACEGKTPAMSQLRHPDSVIELFRGVSVDPAPNKKAGT